MNDIISMQVAKRARHLGRKELDSGFRESLHGEQMVVHIPSSDILQEKVDAIFILKYIVHA